MPLFFPNIYLMATPMEFNETGRKSGGFTFGDYNFDPGPFDSKTCLDSYDIGLYYGIPLLKTATLKKLNIDIGINIRLIDFDVSIHQASSGLDESESGVLPVPMVFAAVQFTPIKKLSFEVEGRGISISGNDLFSLIGRVKVKIFGPVLPPADTGMKNLILMKMMWMLSLRSAGLSWKSAVLSKQCLDEKSPTCGVASQSCNPHVLKYACGCSFACALHLGNFSSKHQGKVETQDFRLNTNIVGYLLVCAQRPSLI